MARRGNTPEGKVKAKVKKVLAQYQTYTHWPVPYGYGMSTLDALICANGFFAAVETKAPGKKPTDRQKQMIAEIERTGGTVFVIDGDTTELEQWLKIHANPNQPKT